MLAVKPRMLTHMARPPLKDRALIKAVRIELLANKVQRDRWAKAAASAGLSLSEWARQALIRAARTG